jgi:gliding motility-associated-like protein
MEEKDFIKELFQEKLAQHQSPVSPELWASVSSSISTGATVVSSGLSVLTKSVIAGLSAAALIGSVWFMNQPASTSTKKPLNNVKRPIEKTETTKTEIPADSNNKLNTDSPVKIQPIPTADLQEEISAFGPGIAGSNNPTVLDPVLSLPPSSTNQSNTTNSLTTVQNNTLVQQEMPVSNIQEAAIILPNVFTPNGDGNNDVFSIDLGSYTFVDYSLVILDKTNQLVFKSSLTQEIWDGKNMNGDRCPKGNYVYYLTGKTDTGKTITKYSTLRIEY